MELDFKECQIADILFEMRCRGIEVRAENGQLRYRAGPGALTSTDKENVLFYKAQILSFLERSTNFAQISAPLLPRPSSRNVVPLLPFQQWLWNWNSGERSTIAIRMGKIDLALLRQTFQELCSRHEALRTRIVLVNGDPQQEITETPCPALRSVTLIGISLSEREREAKKLIEGLASEAVDFSRDLLFDASLIELADQDCILIIRIHCLISDATSRKVLWRDIGHIYAAHICGSPIVLPEILQPGDLSVWHEQSDVQWTRKHHTYWMNRLAGAERICLFPTHGNDQFRNTGVAFSLIVPNVCADLRAFAHQRKTSLGMVILTVWIASIMRWCRKTDVVVSFLTTGRVHAELENAIGLFMCQLFLRIQLEAADTLDDLLTHVIEEYDRAYQNYDFGRVISRTKDTNFVFNPNLYWVPKSFYQAPADALNSTIFGSPVQPFDFSPPAPREIDWSRTDVAFALGESDDDIRGFVLGSASIRTERFQRFADNLRVLTNNLINAPHIPLNEVTCCVDSADFYTPPLAD